MGQRIKQADLPNTDRVKAGDRFWRLKAIVRVEDATEDNNTVWLCGCQCGNLCKKYEADLKAAKAVSCGCFTRSDIPPPTDEELSKDHVQLHRIWLRLKYRKRGATKLMCKRWRESFRLFLRDVGDPPGRFARFTRREKSYGFKPGNTYWAGCGGVEIKPQAGAIDSDTERARSSRLSS